MTWALPALAVTAMLLWMVAPHAIAIDQRGGSGAMLASLLAEDEHPLGKPDDDKPRRHRHGWPALSEKQIDEALELLKDLHPELAEDLIARRAKQQADLPADDPEHVGSIIQRHFPRLRYLLHLKQSDPPMYELRIADVRLTLQSRRLADQYSEALRQEDDQRAEALRADLHALLEEHFEVRQGLRELELKRLEQRIAALHEQIEAHDDDRDNVIEQRLQELTGAEKASHW